MDNLLPPIIDSHAHIYLPEFDVDRDDIILRAKAAGVQKILLPGIDSETIDAMLKLLQKEPNLCFAMMGLHPCSVKENYEEELKIVADYFANPNFKFIAVGECGLDYYWDKSFVDLQKKAFAYQINLAKKLQLPIVIHSRESIDDCIEMIAAHKDENLRGVFHCFSGNAVQLEKIIELGFYAGIGGVVTFKNGGLDKILTQKYLPHLLLETDAPYLAPVPFRGKRNEPAYLTHIVKKLSEIIGITEQEIVDRTTANANHLFFNEHSVKLH